MLVARVLHKNEMSYTKLLSEKCKSASIKYNTFTLFLALVVRLLPKN